MDREDYLKLVEENRELRKTIEFYERQETSLRKEILRERLWRISFQLDYLRGLSDSTKAELGELEAEHGNQAEGPVHSEG